MKHLEEKEENSGNDASEGGRNRGKWNSEEKHWRTALLNVEEALRSGSGGGKRPIITFSKVEEVREVEGRSGRPALTCLHPSTPSLHRRCTLSG